LLPWRHAVSTGHLPGDDDGSMARMVRLPPDHADQTAHRPRQQVSPAARPPCPTGEAFAGPRTAAAGPSWAPRADRAEIGPAVTAPGACGGASGAEGRAGELPGDGSGGPRQG